MSSSSDTSDEEEMDMKLMEAVTNEFTSKISDKETEQQSTRKSKTLVNAQHFNASGNITPEFREHMGKKLFKYLESIIEITENPQKPKCKKKAKGGIYLLHNSKKRSTIDNYEVRENNLIKVKHKRKLSSSDSDEDYEKFAAIAVSGNEVLNGGKGSFQKTIKQKNPNNNNPSDVYKKHKKKKLKHKK